MSIEQLIRDLILEDQFKAKYTSRQRTIFCDNMYAKVSAFVETTNKDRIERIEELEEQLAVAENDRDFYKEENKELSKNYKSVFMDMMATLRIAICLTYLYTIWQYYSDKVERSIKDTNTTSEVPYRIE
jgi:hypothetical protein